MIKYLVRLTVPIALFWLSISDLPAQTPSVFNYQAVVRDSLGILLTSTAIGIQASIIADNASGSATYAETHNPTSNGGGLITLNIGAGTPVTGTMAAIPWQTGTYFLRIELDVNGGTNYTHLSTTQLLSVPYALYAENVANKEDADADPANEIQQLSLNGTDLSISNGNTIQLTNSTDNLGNHTAEQNMTLAGNWISGDGDSEGIYITSNGLVGIGTVAPLYAFEIESAYPVMLLEDVPTGAQVGIQAPTVGIEGSVGTVTNDDFSLYTHNIARLYITNTGDIGIGLATPTERLHVNGNVKGTTFLNSSDRRYKKNIIPIDNALARLEQVNGIYYNWRVRKFPEEDFSNERQIGVIAQDLEKAFPELVVTDRNGYKAVDYPKLTAVLIQANKELHEKLKYLNTKLEEIEPKLIAFDKLSDRLGDLEALIKKQNFDRGQVQND